MEIETITFYAICMKGIAVTTLHTNEIIAWSSVTNFITSIIKSKNADFELTRTELEEMGFECKAFLLPINNIPSE